MMEGVRKSQGGKLMDLAEFKRQVMEPGAKGKTTLMSVLRSIAVDGEVVPLYSLYLERARTCEEFLEYVFQDLELMMDDVWGYAAKLLYPDKALLFFKPSVVVKDVEVVCDTVSFPGDDGGMTVRAPRGCQAVDVYVFEDGAVNELAFKPAGKNEGCFDVGEYHIDGKFSVYHSADAVIIMPWFIDENGERPHARALSAARIRNSKKPASNNC